MSITTIIVVAVAILIIAKTGSLGKAFGFLVKWALFPVIFSLIGSVIGTLVFRGLGSYIGFIIGAIVGIVKAIKDADRKLGGH